MMSMNCCDQEVRVIGIDCATIPQRTGIALGFFSNNDITVQEAFRCSDSTKPEEKVVDWITSSSEHQKTLIAIDAPLGWPVPLTTGLVRHAAGTYIQRSADDLFYRHTERIVLENFGLRPFAVGADLIARTAHAALAMLECIRSELQAEIPLAWSSGNLPIISLIEVYPAATLKSHKITAGSYKKSTKTETRQRISRELPKHMLMEDSIRMKLGSSSHVLDATLCLLAGFDFLRGDCIEPEAELKGMTEREGWIWVKKPDNAE